MTSRTAENQDRGHAGADDRSASAARMRRKAWLELASVAVAIVALTASIQLRPKKGATQPQPYEATAAQPSQAPASEPTVAEAAAAPEPEPEPEPDKPPAPTPAPAPLSAPDRAKVAAAEKALDAASSDRARADARAADAAKRMARAADQAALDAVRARNLGFQVKDPSARISQAVSRGGFVRGERDKLADEIATLRAAPRPRMVSILTKSPVARPVSDNEYHFELRRDRITYIDLDKLLQLTRSDARTRVQLSDRVGTISSKVGPVGAFSLAYELVPVIPNEVERMIERRMGRHYELSGWELIPESDHRGETYDSARNPLSDFNRTINRFNPRRSTVTLWVYPDSFGLYRRIRADLIARGFSVAARPLPSGLGIRGSPMGSQSAAQ